MHRHPFYYKRDVLPGIKTYITLFSQKKMLVSEIINEIGI